MAAQQDVQGKRVAILVTEGFEQAEMVEPRKALDEAGAKTTLLSPMQGQVKAWNEKDWGESFPVDAPLSGANPEDYDALLLPGGVMNPDKLRTMPEAVQFARSFWDSGKPIFAICHGPWLLVEADVVQGLTLTAWPSLQTDIRNAGGSWVDAEVQTYEGLVTSRKPADIPAFNKKMLEELAEGNHADRRRQNRMGFASQNRSDTGMDPLSLDLETGDEMDMIEVVEISGIRA